MNNEKPTESKTVNDLLNEQREALAKNLTEMRKNRDDLSAQIKETERILKAYDKVK